MDFLNAKNPIYPLLGTLVSIATLVFGLLMAKTDSILWFYAGLTVVYLFYGYYRACIGLLPVLIFMVTLFATLTYVVEHNLETTRYAVNRSFAVCFTFIPGLSVSSVRFVRNLRQIKLPKMVTLGMLISLNFFPLLAKEMRQILSAMKSRGAGSIFNYKVFYRAFLLPLVMRIVQISDTLTLSVETRGFTTDKSETTIFEPVKFIWRDFLFLLLFVVCMIGVLLI